MKLERFFLKQLMGLFILASLTSGCGFQPLYQETKNVAINDELKKIYVPTLSGRYGQQMRQYLQQNLAGAGPEDPKTYTLNIAPGLNEEAIDIHYDNSSGRTRVQGNAHWTLQTISADPVVLAQGDAQTLDGYNVTYEQYFAQALNDEAIQGRVAKHLADEVTQQVAIWFENHDSTQHKVESPKVPKANYMLPSMNPGENGTQSQDAGSDGFPAMATGRNTMIPQGMDNMQENERPDTGL